MDILWTEEQARIFKLIKEKHEAGTLGELLVAVDTGWHTRGFKSEYGNFAGKDSNDLDLTAQFKAFCSATTRT